MKIDRKWIVLAALLVIVLLVAGCSGKKKTKTTPPPITTGTTAPSTDDVSATPSPGTTADVEEPTRSMSIQDLQRDLEGRGLLGDVFYDFDKYDLRSDARERLAKNAEFLRSSEGASLHFTVEGHCDERGTNEYNLALGQRRSTAAVDYLVSLGVDRGRFKTISYGEEKPFCTESTEGCWQQNRRARFVITERM